MGRFFICASSLSGCALTVLFSLIHFRMARVRGSLVLGYCNFSLFAIAAGFAPRSLSFTASLRMSNSERPTPSSPPGRANLRSSSSKSFSSVSFFARARLRPAQRRQQAPAPGFLRGLIPAHLYRNPFVPWLRFLTYSALCNGHDTLHRSAPEGCAFVFLNRCTSQLRVLRALSPACWVYAHVIANLTAKQMVGGREPCLPQNQAPSSRSKRKPGFIDFCTMHDMFVRAVQ